jgi:hypothetical protein
MTVQRIKTSFLFICPPISPITVIYFFSAFRLHEYWKPLPFITIDQDLDKINSAEVEIER